MGTNLLFSFIFIYLFLNPYIYITDRELYIMVRDTSLSAYISISPILGHKQQIVFDTIKLLGSPTDLEITQYLNLGDPNKVRPRRNELLKNGSIVECEKRECSVSGRTVWSWRIKNE
jgi:hypothetical protein